VDLSLRQLQVILAVSDERSFTSAGKRLFLSQQSVSALVRSAEARLGIRLFERTTRSVEPTSVCRDIVPDIRFALDRIDVALRRARSAGVSEPTLVVGVSPSVAIGELRLLLAALEERGLPEPDFREVWFDELLEGLREGRFDAGIGVEIVGIPQCEVTPWRRQRVDLLVSEAHPFAKMPEVPVSLLEDIHLFVPGERTNPALRNRFLATLQNAGVHPRLTDVARIAGPAPIAVERGSAATVWLTGMDERYLPAGLVRVRLCEPETWVTTSLVTVSGTSAAAPVSLDALRQTMDENRDPSFV